MTHRAQSVVETSSSRLELIVHALQIEMSYETASLVVTSCFVYTLVPFSPSPLVLVLVV